MPNFGENTNMWVPRSHEIREAAAVNKAVREYDPDLAFGQHPQTSQWCVFLKAGSSAAASGADLPIMGFSDIPHPDDALRRIHQADAVRTGRDIMQNIERHNASVKAVGEQKASEASEETAEAYDWAFRQMGKAPHSKILRPVKEVGY